MKRLVLTGATLLLGMACTAFAAGDPDRGAVLYQTCASCHGSDAGGMYLSNAPTLAGQYDWYLETQLKNFQGGVRGTHAGDVQGQMMKPFSLTLADEQAVADVVAYIGTLAAEPQAFVRPSPAGVTRGGVAARTRECVYLCEAAGFDLVIVETIGVGQVELTVAGITDILLLLLLPGTGDELQGMKRGAMELADLVLVNKADGPMRNVALATVADYRQALRLTRQSRSGEGVEVIAVSALEDQGIAEVLQKLLKLHEKRRDSGVLAARRAEQCRDWLWQAIREAFLESMVGKISPQDRVTELEREVVAGRMTASLAARQFVNASVGRHPGDVS